MRGLFAAAALLLAWPCHAAWDDQVVLVSPDPGQCRFWQLSRAADFSRNDLSLDWALVDELALDAGGEQAMAIAVDQWDPARGAPTAGSRNQATAVYCSIATREPAPPARPKGGRKGRAEAVLQGAHISGIACYRRQGAGKIETVFGRRSQQAVRDGAVRYTHECSEGCGQAPFPRIHELSMDDGPENPAHEKDLNAFYQACRRR